MLTRICTAAFIGLFACVPAWSEDVEIIPQEGAGFAVKNAANDSIRFKVNESGEVIIPSLPVNMAGTPLCWDKTTGILQQCPDAAGTDFVPPTIEVDAPAVAVQAETEVVIQVADNVELSQLLSELHVSDSSNFTPNVYKLFPAGTKKAEKKEILRTGLSSEPTKVTYVVTDTSGNTAKKDLVISFPETAFVMGDYDIVGSVTVPDGFDCRPDLPGERSDDGIPITGFLAEISGSRYGCSWSVALGYCLSMEARGYIHQSSYLPFSFSVSNDSKVPLDTRFLSLDSYTRVYGNILWRYNGTFEITNSDPPTIQATIIKQCNIDGAGWIDGVPLSFTAQLPE